MPIWVSAGSALVLVLAVGAFVAWDLPAAASPLALSPQASGPDLVPTDVTMTPSIASDREVVRLDIRIENVGDLAAWAATITVVESMPNGDVVTMKSSLSAPLNPGAHVIVAMPVVIVGAGEHTFTVRVTEVSPPETNTSNNLRFVRVAIRPADGVQPPPPPVSDGDVRISALDGLGLGGLIVLAALVMIAGLTISVALRDSPDETLVPPPPEPPDRRPPPIWPP